MITPAEYSKEWLEHANRDMRSAKYLMGMQPAPYEIICFHCQQTAEKALKGFLIFHGQEAPRTHDLESLCNMCGELDTNFFVHTNVCMDLTRYAVASRYPNNMQIEMEDAKTALEDAAAILAYVENRIQ